MKVRSTSPQRIFSLPGIFCLVFMFAVLILPAASAQEVAEPDMEQADQAATDDETESLPLSPTEKAEMEGTAVELSLQDIIRLAMQNNIDIAVDEIGQQSSQLSFMSAQAAWDPSLRGSLGISSRKSANTNRFDSSLEEVNSSKTVDWSANFSQPVKLTGGTLSASYSGSRATSNSNSTLYNPNFQGRTNVQFSQPLLKNLKIDSNRSQIKIRKIDLDIRDSQFRRTVSSTISQITRQYWDLVSAIRNYDIQRNALELAQRNLRDVKKKVEVGTLAPIEITQASYQVAQTRLRLINAEDQIHRQMNSMRQYISDDRHNNIWSKVIIPTDTPEFQEFKIDEALAIETALANRPELKQIDLQLKQSDIQLKLARNNRRWGVDLSASFNTSGSAGNYVCDPSQAFCVEPPDYQTGGFAQAFRNMFDGRFTGWSFSVDLQVPIRNRSNDIALANQLIQRRQTELNRKKQEQSIQVELRNAVQTVETSRQQVETAKLNRELAQEQLDGENKRFEAGLSEFYRVLDQQNRLAEAENGELSALIDYKKSVISLQDSMNTLLEYNDVKISTSASDHIPDLKIFE
ncbi:MAG: TolC family protein [Acidobacteriota bacterium]|jgi:outer membrane protein